MDITRESVALLRACQGAEPGRSEGYRRLGRLLYRVAWARVADDSRLHPLAEEAMQESLMAVWRHLEAGLGPVPEAFVPWAMAIVVNKVRELVRRQEPVGIHRPTRRVAASRQVSLDAPSEVTGESLADRLPDPGQSPEAALHYTELQALVAEIGQQTAISASSRTVLLRGFPEGLDDGELAEVLGTSRANVHVIRCRDLAKLREVPGFVARLQRLAAGR